MVEFYCITMMNMLMYKQAFTKTKSTKSTKYIDNSTTDRRIWRKIGNDTST